MKWNSNKDLPTVKGTADDNYPRRLVDFQRFKKAIDKEIMSQMIHLKQISTRQKNFT